MDDVTRAVQALIDKQVTYDNLWAYYDGIQPLRYSTKRLAEIFRGLDARFTQNWCEVVVNSALERIEVEQLVVPGDSDASATETLWWNGSGLDIDADDVHLCALVTGEAFVIAWPSAEGAMEAYYNDSRLAHVFYDSERPRENRFAAKWWDSDDGARLTLYYPDRLFYFGSSKARKEIRNAKQFQPLGDLIEGAESEAPNPLGIVPVFHFRRETRGIKSELSPSLLDMQDSINKLLADMMVAAEFGAFKQRYVISAMDTGTLKNAPNEIWNLAAGDGLMQDTEVGEFAETNLGNFMTQVQDLAVAMAKISRTPQSYFFLGARADPSGEALAAMESALVKKCEKYIKRFGREWRTLLATVRNAAPIPTFADPRTTQPFTQAQTRQMNVSAGIPLKTQLRREGWTEPELAQLDADAQAAQAAQAETLAQAMLNQQRAFDGA